MKDEDPYLADHCRLQLPAIDTLAAVIEAPCV
jgi:hypothetical protein